MLEQPCRGRHMWSLGVTSRRGDPFSTPSLRSVWAPAGIWRLGVSRTILLNRLPIANQSRHCLFCHCCHGPGSAKAALTCVHSGSIFPSFHLHLHLASGSNRNTLSSILFWHSSARVSSVHFQNSILIGAICQRNALPWKKLSVEMNTRHIEKHFELSLYLASLSQCGSSHTHSSNCSCNPRPD